MSDSEELMNSKNKGLAMLIAILALLLAFSELGGSNADNEAIESNVEASNLWAFFQAKTIRRTSTLIAADDMKIRLAATSEPALKASMEKQIAAWQAAIAGYDSDPKNNDGRKELMTRARVAEENRKLQKAKGDIYDISSALFQIGIVLASATIITGMIALAWLAIALGGVGLLLLGFALLSPLKLAAFL